MFNYIQDQRMLHRVTALFQVIEPASYFKRFCFFMLHVECAAGSPFGGSVRQALAGEVKHSCSTKAQHGLRLWRIILIAELVFGARLQTVSRFRLINRICGKGGRKKPVIVSVTSMSDGPFYTLLQSLNELPVTVVALATHTVAQMQIEPKQSKTDLLFTAT